VQMDFAVKFENVNINVYFCMREKFFVMLIK